MSEKSAYDAVVIGAGVIGCAIALDLARRGLSTLNVDRGPAPGHGSTSWSAAIIRPYYSTIDGTALAYEAHFAWQNWTDYLGYRPDTALHYNECGCLVLEAADNRQLAGTRAIMREVGVPFTDVGPAELPEWLPGADLRQFSPARRIDDPRFGETAGEPITGAMFCPTGGYISDPQLATAQIAGAVERAGGQFRFNDTVLAIHQSSGEITGLTCEKGGLIHAPIVINAAGPASRWVNDLAGPRQPDQIVTRPLRQEVAHVRMPQTPQGPGLRFVLTDADCGIYMRPEQSDHLLIGSLEPACDHLEYLDSEDYETSLTEQWTNQVWRAALRFPDLGIPNTATGFAALYDVSEDWIPVYDRSDITGYFTAIGTSGNQFKNAPLVGQLMGHLIESVMNGADHDTAPLRFHLPVAGRDVGLEAFSRLRPINRASSFSVLG
ncbi:MAG: FAD-dependent oxidoreductase [Novosphingobium sp.]|uniref:NAD(P)/FAD-dependent oxidoreductase n=1 Tax=Novosphingobium sp. TaxID=1874826 RepID=UPI00301A0D61